MPACQIGLVTQAKWLPQYKREVRKAKARLADHEKHGTRVKLRKTEDAARLRTKNANENAQSNAAAQSQPMP